MAYGKAEIELISWYKVIADHEPLTYAQSNLKWMMSQNLMKTWGTNDLDFIEKLFKIQVYLGNWL